ncbi:Transcription factor GRAS [Dillenia turbinata]|uniref:Transcription factor GRAS n=1 Tax=Dillenia turbinata TaxID=194707 RepID=A0AAN8ZC80_9MAGN
MQTSQNLQSSSTSIQGFYHPPLQEIDSYLSHFHDSGSQGSQLSVQTCNEQFFTLDSCPAIAGYAVFDSPAPSVSSNRDSFSPQGSQSYFSDPHPSPENNYGSPMSFNSVADNDYELRHELRKLETFLLGPEPDMVGSCICSFNTGVHQAASTTNWSQLVEMIPNLDLKKVLIACAHAISEADLSRANDLMDVLGQMVSVSGEPIQRLSAYMLEGLRARLEASGTSICKKLRCKEPTSSELMSYMGVLYQVCPYYKFAYTSSNVLIGDAMANESRIHIIDFQIAQGSQWIQFIQALACRPGGPPFIRITGVDDSQSTYARGGGLHIVGEKIAQVARSYGVPFEFHASAMSGCEVELGNLGVRPGEAIAVNFPYMLHHMPDESVTTVNHRDRLLRLVKSLSPKIVTLLEQESKTNTTPFFQRFLETLDYYTAMFESIDVKLPRDDKQRISAEQHCVARDIVNIIACEGVERVERHELLGKWRSRFNMAGFSQCPLNSSVGYAIKDVLKDYHGNFRLEHREGALYLHWKHRAMVTCSAWR